MLAAKVEFLDITENAMREGKPLNMAQLEAEYVSILEANEVNNPSCSRKTVKQMITAEILDVEFHRPNH